VLACTPRVVQSATTHETWRAQPEQIHHFLRAS
jgi:hypothetical protein